ncbi:hypothetical protein FHS23_002942 [Prauserella isguenensis]|uniref:Uncharacterized protein n=1 Tax=Prauserella isguenensis TaxID=1470180 RepID=A0A839S3R2_9PSEU|nr:hypothetical protein [Prauserella isguenensis]MBB3051913.1 hypothetical protein [Prauserella isguenensis]
MHVVSTCDPADRLVRDLRFERTLGDRGATGPVDRETVLAHRRRTGGTSAEDLVEIKFDGQPRTFRRWGTGHRWYAAREPDRHPAIVIAARHIDPDEVALVPVHDIEPYLAGRRDRIRAHRQPG